MPQWPVKFWEFSGPRKKETGKGTGLRRKHARPTALPALRHVSLECVEGTTQQFCMMSLPDILQAKVVDEAVPGNPLAPDLRRKAAMTYVALADFPALGLDAAWLTLAVARTQDLQAIYLRVTANICLRFCAPFSGKLQMVSHCSWLMLTASAYSRGGEARRVSSAACAAPTCCPGSAKMSETMSTSAVQT